MKLSTTASTSSSLLLHLLLICLPFLKASISDTTDSGSMGLTVAKKDRQPKRMEKIGECPTSPFRMAKHRTTPPKAPAALKTTFSPFNTGNSVIGGIASPPPPPPSNVQSRDLGQFSEHQKQHHQREYQQTDANGGSRTISHTHGGHRISTGLPYSSSPPSPLPLPQMQRSYSPQPQLQPQQYGYQQNYYTPPQSPMQQFQSFSPTAPQLPRLDYYDQRMTYGGIYGNGSTGNNNYDNNISMSLSPPPYIPLQQLQRSYSPQPQLQHPQLQQRYKQYETEQQQQQQQQQQQRYFQQQLYLQQQQQQQQQQYYLQQQQRYLQHSPLPLPLPSPPPTPTPSTRHQFKEVQRSASIDNISEGSDSEIGKINFPSADEDDEDKDVDENDDDDEDDDLKVSKDFGLGFGFKQDKKILVMTDDDVDNDVDDEEEEIDVNDEPFKILEALSEGEILKKFSDLQVDVGVNVNDDSNVETSPTTTTYIYTPPPQYKRKSSPTSPEDKRSYKGELVVATWNVSSLRATDKDRLKRVAKRLKELNADVIILSEISNTDNTVSSLRSILGDMYREYMFECRDTYLGMGVAILSKVKLDDNLTPSTSPSMNSLNNGSSCSSGNSSSPISYCSHSTSSKSRSNSSSPSSYGTTKKSDRRSPSLEAAAKSGIIKGTIWDDQGRPVRIAIVALHLLARGGGGGGGMTPEDRIAYKENQACGIRNEIDHLSTLGNYKVIVGGDFNAPDIDIPDGGTCCLPATQTLKIIKGKDLQNAAHLLKRPKTHHSGLIDHILVDSALSVLDTSIVESSKESDHSILVTKICISSTPHYYTSSFTKGHRSSSGGGGGGGSPLTTIDGMCYLETPPPKTTMTMTSNNSKSPSPGVHPQSLIEKSKSSSTNNVVGSNRKGSPAAGYKPKTTTLSSAPPSILESIMGSIQGNTKSKK